MRKYIYILLMSCIVGTLQADNAVGISLGIYSTMVEAKRIYTITTNDKRITINRLQPNSYIMVFDASGRNIYKGTVNSGAVSVSVRCGGMFIIRIQKDKEIYTEKIMVK